MSVALLVGLAGIGGAIGLGGVAAVSGNTGAKTQPGIDAIEQYYSRGVTQYQPLTAAEPLSPLMQRLRAVATKLSPASAATRIQHQLDVAGNPGGWTAERVLAFKGIGLIGLGLLGLLIGLKSPAMLLFAPVIGAAAGFFVPDLLVYNTGLKRQEKLLKALPDGLDMLTICVEAGLGFDAAMLQLAQTTSGPLAQEFGRVLQEMQFGVSRVQALKALTERTTVPELRTFVSALVQAAELGIPVAAVLREQAIEMRTRRRQLGEEKAQKVTVKILFPLIFCLFPALFVVVIGPGALNIIHTFTKL